MSDQVLRDLLEEAAPEPARLLDSDDLLGRARRRHARRRTAMVTPLLFSAALVALPVVNWPDLPDGPDIGRMLSGDESTAPVVTGRFPSGAVVGGQAPAEPGTDVVELASARQPNGERLVFVAYRTPTGDHCSGFVGSENIGLPSSCHPQLSVADKDGLVFGKYGEQNASQEFIDIVYVWGSAPGDASFVRLSSGSGQSVDYPVTTSDDGDFNERTYFVAIVEAGFDITGGTAHDKDGNVVATR